MEAGCIVYPLFCATHLRAALTPDPDSTELWRMNTMLTANGQVRLPAPARRALGLKTGDKLRVEIERGGVRLEPPRRKISRVVMRRDPVTKLPFFAPPAGTPVLTLAAVKQTLRDFP